MIDLLALSFSVVALTVAGVLLRRDAVRWKKAEGFKYGYDDGGKWTYTGSTKPSVGRFLESLVQRHRNETATPSHSTSLASVKDIIAAAERESAKPRFSR